MFFIIVTSSSAGRDDTAIFKSLWLTCPWERATAQQPDSSQFPMGRATGPEMSSCYLLEFVAPDCVAAVADHLYTPCLDIFLYRP